MLSSRILPRTLGATILAAALTVPALGEDLLWHSPDATLELAGEPRPTGSRGLRLINHDDAVIAVRSWYPANTDLAPHPHPAGKVAVITVLTGEIALGLGDTFDEAALKPVPVGTTVVLRAGDPQHFGRTGPEGAQLLILAAPEGSVTSSLLASE
jgi:hypothetical protein